jgi:hypothetical protein
MTDEEVALHFAAADVVFIQRLDDLNSGNIPMAFLFRRTVLGPDCGNIGEWLQTTDNPVFDPADRNSVRLALIGALALAEEGKGDENSRFAHTRWTTRKVGEATARLYESLAHE